MLSPARALACLVFCLLPALAVAATTCPPEGSSKQQLFELRQNGFAMDDAPERNALAIALLSCLASPDPAIRDGVVYEGTANWLRARSLSRETTLVLYANLLAQLDSADDPGGFQQPFAALLLSEVARADRIEPVLTPAMRDELVSAAADYLAGIDDYRGFSEEEGWRHGVAHGSDLVVQLALNPAIEATQLKRLLNALAVQIAPTGAVFYIYGEPGRLARAVYYAYTRDLLDEAFWAGWFEGVSNPGPLATWNESFASQAGLARRHNTLSFLLALHFNASLAEEKEQGAALSELVLQAVTRISGG